MHLVLRSAGSVTSKPSKPITKLNKLWTFKKINRMIAGFFMMIGLGLLTQTAIAIPRTWNGAGKSGGSTATDLNNVSNWSPNTGTSITGDDLTITIDANTSPTLNFSASVSINSLTINFTGSGNGSNARINNINLASGITVTIAGNLTVDNNGTGNASHKVILTSGIAGSAAGTWIIKGNTNIGSSSTLSCQLAGAALGTSSASGEWAFWGNVTFGTKCTISEAAYPQYWTFDGTGVQSWVVNSSNIDMSVIKTGAVRFGNTNNPTVNLTGSSNPTIDGNTAYAPVIIKAGSVLDLGVNTLQHVSTVNTQDIFTVSGTLRLAGITGGQTGSNFPSGYQSYSLGSTSTVEYYGPAQTVSATPSYGNLTLTNANTKTAGGALTIKGDLLINTGATLAAASNAINISGDWTNNGTFTPGTQTVTFDAFSPNIQTLKSNGSAFSSVSHTGTGTLQLVTNALATTAAFINSAGTFDANALAHTVSGLATVSGGVYLASTAQQTFNGGLTVSGGTFTSSTGNVAASNVTISSGTLTAPTGTFNVSGNWSKTGGTFTPGTGTVTFIGTGNPTLASGGSSFNNIMHSGTGSLTLNTSALNTGGTFLNSAGTFSAGTLAHTVTGLATVSGGTYTAGTGAQTFNGGLTISGGIFTGSSGAVTATDVTLTSGTLTAPTTGAFNVTGNWQNNGGTFTPGTGTVTFSGVAQNITGSTTFNNVTFSGSNTKILGVATTISVSGLLNINTGVKADLGTTTSSASSLTLGGVSQLSGSYGGTSSAATYVNPTFFATNTGILNVNSGCIPGNWVGGTSIDWFTASNWCGGVVPTAATNVVIASGTPNQPTIGAAGAICNNLTINVGATLTITGTNGLTVSGNWVNSGTFTSGSSTVDFNASGSQTVNNGTQSFYNVTHSGSGTLQLIINALTVSNFFNNSGGGIVDLNAKAMTVGDLSGNGIISNSGALVSLATQQLNNSTFSGAINGAINFSKTNNLTTITLSSNTSTYSGTTSIGGGIIKLGAAGTAPNGPLGTTGGGTSITNGPINALDLNGFTLATAEPLSISYGGTLTNTSATAVSYSGPITLVTSAGTISSIITNPGDITLTNTATIGGTNLNLAIGGTGNGLIAGVISTGTGTVTKSGTGTWTLSGSNSYTGKTTVSAGTLNFSTIQSVSTGNSSLGAPTTVANGTIDLGATGILRYTGSGNSSNRIINLTADGGSIDASGTGDLTLSGGVTGNTFDVVLTGTANGILSGVINTTSGTATKNSTGTWTLSGANTYTGLTAVNSGILDIKNNTALGTTAGATTISSGAAVQVDGSGLTIAEPVTINNSTGLSNRGAIRNLANNNIWSGAIILTTAGRVNSDAGTLTISGGIGGTGTAFTIGGAGNTAITTAGIGTSTGGTVLKDGTGTLTVSAGGSYTGLTTVSAGVLNVQNATATGTIAGGVSVSSGAALQIQGGTTVGAEAVSLSGTGISNDGALRNISGTNTWGGTVTLNTASIIQSDAGILTLNNASAITGTNTNLTLQGAGSGAINGSIATGSGTLTQTATGAWTLTGPNSYTGLTTISAGTLSLNAPAANTNNVIIGDININGGTLNYASAIDQQIDNNSDIILSSGTFNLGARTETVGSLSMTGGNIIKGGNFLALANASSITGGVLNFSTAANTSLVAANSLALGNATFNYSNGATPGTNTLNLFTASSDLSYSSSNTGPTIFSNTASGSGDVQIGSIGMLRTFNIASASLGVPEVQIGWTLSQGSGAASSLLKSGTGILLLKNSLSYTGTTTISAGELRLNPTNMSVATSQLVLSGGIFSTTGIATGGTITNTAPTTFLLNLAANSAINLGSNVHTVTFGNSSGVNWVGSTLTINGWTGTAGASGTAGKILVGVGGLNAGQLSKISFAGYSCTATLLSTGELVPAAPPTAGTSNTNGLALSCTIPSTTLTANGVGTYLWSTGATTQSITVTTAGTFTVTVTGSNVCTTTSSVTTTLDNTPPALGISNNNGLALSCTVPSTTLTANGVGTYSWSTGATTQSITVTTAGTLTVTVTGSNGCTTTSSVTTTLDNTPPASGISNNNGLALSCTVPLTTLTANGVGTYSWSTGATTQSITVSTAGTFTVTVTGSNGCTTTSSVTTTLNNTNTWTSSTVMGSPTDWNNPNNWSCGIVPNSSTSDVSIQVVGSGNYPIIDATTFTVRNITIATGATLNTTSAGILDVSGTYSNAGTLANNGKIILSGSSADYSFPGVTSAMNELEIDKTLGIVSVDQSFTITGVLKPTAGTLNLGNNFITLKSDATNTARVGIAGANFTYGTGRFIVQRYFIDKRAWRLMTAPVTSSNTIFNAWQAGGIYTPGEGEFVTGPGGLNGLDPAVNNNYSLKTFNPVTQALVPVTNTNTVNVSPGTNGSADNIGYFNFVRGDRSPGLSADHATGSTFTTLSSTGKLQTGQQTFSYTGIPASTNTAPKFILIGNPYASPVDFGLIAKSSIEDKFWAWDPSLNLAGGNGVGGYVFFAGDGLGGYTVVPTAYSGGQTQNIQTGQAIYVQTQVGVTSPSVTFQESYKTGVTTTTPAVFRPLNASTASAIEGLAVNLNFVNAGAATLADGVLAQFNAAYSNDVDALDGFKLTNVNENFGLKRGASLLTLERRQPVTSTDTLFLNITRPTQSNYQFEFIPQNITDANLTAFLEDSYLQTSTPISMSAKSSINFSYTADAASAVTNRFRIVLKASAGGPLPITFTSLKAWQQSNAINVAWKVDNEMNMKEYQVERSADGRNFSKAVTLKATGNNNSSVNYQWPDASPAAGNNYYRISSIDVNGKVQYSNIVKVFIGKGKTELLVYPNPVTNGNINLQLVNQPKGRYYVRLLNKLGQEMMAREIEHEEGSSTETMQLHKTMAHGTYQLEITKPDNTKININVLN